MASLPDLPAARHGVFTAQEALAVGWTRASLKWAVRTGTLVRLDRGIFAAPTDGDDPAARRERFAAMSVAAVLAARPAVASHRSAAVLAGLRVWNLPDRACVTVSPRYTGDARRGHLHRATLWTPDVLRGVVDRTASARSVVDIARECGVEEAVVVADDAIARRLTDLDRIGQAAARCRGWPGFRRAAAAIELIDARAESPLESASRVRLITAGVPAPEAQTEILDLAGYRIGFVDLYWDEYGVVGEVDGKDKYPRNDPFEAWWREKRRHERLREVGLPVVRWGRADLENIPHLAWRLAEAFAEGRRRTGARRWIARSTDRFAPRMTA